MPRREPLPREFARDHRIAQAFYDANEEIWRHRLNADCSVPEPSWSPLDDRKTIAWLAAAGALVAVLALTL